MFYKLRVIAFITASLVFTSCELLVDYSGSYSGTVDVSVTVMGNTTTSQSPLSVVVTKESGIYYFDGVPLEGAGSSYSYTESDYIVNLEFTSTSLSMAYDYEIDLGGGMLYEYVISGTLDKQ